MRTSGAYPSTCSHRSPAAGAPGSCSSSTPPARCFISGSQCPPTASGLSPSRDKTLGRRFAGATAAVMARSLARSDPTSAIAASSSPAAVPTCTITSRTSESLWGSMASTPVLCETSPDLPESEPPASDVCPTLTSLPLCECAPSKPAWTSARATTLSPPGPPAPHRSQASWVRMSPGLVRRSHSTSTDIPGRTAPGEFELSSLFALVIRLPMLCGLLMPPCLALRTFVLERRTMGNALATDGGKLHLSVTHTSLDCRPNAWMISVAAGVSEAIVHVFDGGGWGTALGVCRCPSSPSPR
mmetsp:Transcript_7260/g.28571  ORF Transcript_7260/g.28571 Transcript_7260/m.28571 type:complete len:299 (-) Transcript_7260:1587-2483(-)